MTGRLTLVAGRGALVSLGAAAARLAGWKVSIVAVDPTDLGGEALVAPLDEPEAFLSALSATKPDALCFVGAVRVSDTARAQLAQMLTGRSATLDDDALLDLAPMVAARLNAQLLGIQDLLPELLARPGQLTNPPGLPGPLRALAQQALASARAIGATRLGQAVVTQGTRPIAAEDATGTDALLRRVADMRTKDLVGQADAPLILAKAARPGQTQQLDLPTIGPRTIALAAGAGIGIIVIEAGKTLLVDRPALLADANRHGIVLVALDLAAND